MLILKILLVLAAAAALVLHDILNFCLPTVCHLTKRGSQPECRDLQGDHRLLFGGTFKTFA